MPTGFYFLAIVVFGSKNIFRPSTFSAEAKFLVAESEPSMESMTNIFPHTYCKLSTALEELGYK